SATVYAASDIALKENAPLGPVNVYGRTKLAVETLLSDVAGSDPSWRIAVLRYFNPAGGHASGLLREAPSGVPENLVPMIAQLAAGERSVLSVFGTDYPTEDGTALRDYIHVSDLADGHIAALHALDERQGVLTLNLGTGTATSVRQLVRAFETELGRKLPVTNAPRRDGDAPISFADTEKARRELSWQPKRGIKDICRDALLGRLD
ncbi:MAG: NAD-dependent epimerase/dehydratase family protein, partial [Pseudomonadota bacterium]